MKQIALSWILTRISIKYLKCNRNHKMHKRQTFRNIYIQKYIQTSDQTYLRFAPLADFCSFNCCDTTIVRNQVVPSSKLTGSVGYYIIFNRGFAQKFITMLLSLKQVCVKLFAFLETKLCTSGCISNSYPFQIPQSENNAISTFAISSTHDCFVVMPFFRGSGMHAYRAKQSDSSRQVGKFFNGSK